MAAYGTAEPFERDSGVVIVHVQNDIQIKIVVEDLGKFVDVTATICFIDTQDGVNNLSDNRGPGALAPATLIIGDDRWRDMHLFREQPGRNVEEQAPFFQRLSRRLGKGNLPCHFFCKTGPQCGVHGRSIGSAILYN